MPEVELRREVQKHRSGLTDEAWGYLAEKGFVSEALDGAVDDPVAYLIGEYDQLPKLSKQPSRVKSDREKELVPEGLSEYELSRSRAFSEFVAHAASRGQRVRRFRERYLEGGVVTPAQAYNILRSPITAHHSRLAFWKWEASIPDHTYSRVKQVPDDDIRIIYTLDSSKEKPLSVSDGRPYEAGSWYVGGSSKTFRSFSDTRQEVRDYKMLRFPAEKGEIHSVFAKRASVLGDLQKTVTRLLEDFPWFEPDALWFLLTGTTPYVAPLTIRSKQKGKAFSEPPDYTSARFDYGLMSITVEPWMSAETVKRVFLAHQRGWLGGDNRPIGKKNLTLYIFVSERLLDKLGSLNPSVEDKRRVGSTLVAAWDREYPGWAYRKNSHDFWRDYAAARKRIATPAYQYFKD